MPSPESRRADDCTAFNDSSAVRKTGGTLTAGHACSHAGTAFVRRRPWHSKRRRDVGEVKIAKLDLAFYWRLFVCVVGVFEFALATGFYPCDKTLMNFGQHGNLPFC